MPNQRQILHYISFYQNVLEKSGLVVSWEDLQRLIPVVNLIFEVDSLYDLEDSSLSSQKVEELQARMSQLMGDTSPLTQPAIKRFFHAMEQELTEDLGDALTDYLHISRYSIGAELLSSYIAYLLKVPPEIWFSATINRFNQDIYTLIRLANDYLDVSIEQKRLKGERMQVQATDFFSNLWLFKGYFLVRFLFHKFRYYCYLIFSKYFYFSFTKQMYLTAIICAESILTWAYKVYVTDQNSVHEV